MNRLLAVFQIQPLGPHSDPWTHTHKQLGHHNISSNSQMHFGVEICTYVPICRRMCALGLLVRACLHRAPAVASAWVLHTQEQVHTQGQVLPAHQHCMWVEMAATIQYIDSTDEMLGQSFRDANSNHSFQTTFNESHPAYGGMQFHALFVMHFCCLRAS